jgi:hypothetical protein
MSLGKSEMLPVVLAAWAANILFVCCRRISFIQSQYLTQRVYS